MRRKKTLMGATLFVDYTPDEKQRLVLVNMSGRIVWDYNLPKDLLSGKNPEIDVELLPNDNALFVIPSKGVYEVNRKGDKIWFFSDNTISTDADRLDNGNTLIVCAKTDQEGSAQIKEINPAGKIVWSWPAKSQSPEKSGQNKEKTGKRDVLGKSQVLVATRLANGNTFIGLDNNTTIEVDAQGKMIWSFDWQRFGQAIQDPQLLPNGHILTVLRAKAGNEQVLEIARDSGKVVWEYHDQTMTHLRHCQRLSNGNTLVVAANQIIEVTPEKEIVWHLKTGLELKKQNASRYLYRAHRVASKKRTSFTQ